MSNSLYKAMSEGQTRRARGRRPFLVMKKDMLEGESSEDKAAENSNAALENEDNEWWSTKTDAVLEWIRSNPLFLGIEEESVNLVREQIKRGSASGVGSDKKLKCWKHICIEFEDVPGNPLLNDTSFELEIQKVNRTALDLKHRSIAQSKVETENTTLNAIPSNPVEIDERIDEEKHEEVEAENNKRNKIYSNETKNEVPGKASNESASSSPKYKNDLMQSKDSKSRVTVTEDVKSSNNETETETSEKPPVGAAATMSMEKKLSSMSLLERQQFCLNRKREKEKEIREKREKEETALCTFEPKRATARNFTKVESIIKKQSKPQRRSTIGDIRSIRKSDSSSSIRSSNLSQKPSSTSNEGNQKTVVRKRPSVRRANSDRIKKTTNIEKSTASDLLLACQQELQQSRTAASKTDTEIPKVPTPRTSIENSDSTQPIIEASNKEENELTKSMTPQEEIPISEPPKVELKYRFAPNSTDDKGKITLQDHNMFQLDSFYRKRDRGSAKLGVSLLMGRREDTHSEQVVSVVFDRSKFSEESANEWMNRNIHRFRLGGNS